MTPVGAAVLSASVEDPSVAVVSLSPDVFGTSVIVFGNWATPHHGYGTSHPVYPGSSVM